MVGPLLLLDQTRDDLVLVWRQSLSHIQRHILTFGLSVSRIQGKMKHTSGGSQRMVAVIVSSSSAASSSKSPGSSDKRSAKTSCSGVSQSEVLGRFYNPNTTPKDKE